MTLRTLGLGDVSEFHHSDDQKLLEDRGENFKLRNPPSDGMKRMDAVRVFLRVIIGNELLSAVFWPGLDI